MVVFFGLGKTVVPGWTLIFVGVHCFQQLSLYLLIPENIKRRSLPFQLFRFVPSQLQRAA